MNIGSLSFYPVGTHFVPRHRSRRSQHLETQEVMTLIFLFGTEP
jgi:hypothetical protein